MSQRILNGTFAIIHVWIECIAIGKSLIILVIFIGIFQLGNIKFYTALSRNTHGINVTAIFHGTIVGHDTGP